MDINNIGELKTKEDVLIVIDKLHSKAMKDCGATSNPAKTSEALVAFEGILKFAHSQKG